MPSNVTIQINKYDIERLNIKAVTDILDSFIPELLERNRNRVEISVIGYGDDPRELYDIAEVRLYFQKLFDVVHRAFYWIDIKRYMFILWGLMLFHPIRINGNVTLSDNDLQLYLKYGLMKLNYFCEINNVSPHPTNALIQSIF